jgi:hypothetical protein
LIDPQKFYDVWEMLTPGINPNPKGDPNLAPIASSNGKK